MSIALEIQCIRKTNRFEAHDRIHSVGGTAPDGAQWRLSQQEAVAAIDKSTHCFWIRDIGGSLDVITATSRWGFRYIKTTADDVQPDRLLELPNCP